MSAHLPTHGMHPAARPLPGAFPGRTPGDPILAFPSILAQWSGSWRERELRLRAVTPWSSQTPERLHGILVAWSMSLPGQGQGSLATAFPESRVHCSPPLEACGQRPTCSKISPS